MLSTYKPRLPVFTLQARLDMIDILTYQTNPDKTCVETDLTKHQILTKYRCDSVSNCMAQMETSNSHCNHMLTTPNIIQSLAHLSHNSRTCSSPPRNPKQHPQPQIPPPSSTFIQNVNFTPISNPYRFTRCHYANI